MDQVKLTGGPLVKACWVLHCNQEVPGPLRRQLSLGRGGIDHSKSEKSRFQRSIDESNVEKFELSITYLSGVLTALLEVLLGLSSGEAISSRSEFKRLLTLPLIPVKSQKSFQKSQNQSLKIRISCQISAFVFNRWWTFRSRDNHRKSLSKFSYQSKN